MRRITGRLPAFILIICLLAGCGAAFAGGLHTEVENPSLEAEVLLGYDGRITYGKAVPVRVTVRNSGEDLEGTVAVNAYADEVKYDRFETGIFVPAGGERTVVLPVTAGTRQETFTAEILRNGETLLAVNASPEGIINPSAMMIGVLSTRPRNLANLDITQENDTLLRYEYWQTVALDPETLPDERGLLDAFGMIIADDVDPASLTEKQRQALLDWVSRGHVLVLGGGTSAPQNLQLAGGFMTLQTVGFTVSDRVVFALENYMEQKSSGRTPEIAIAALAGEDPMISDENGNGLVWRAASGSGRIYALAWEAGNATLNAESLMHTFFQKMLLREDATLYNNMLYTDGEANARYIPDEETRLTLRNPMPAAAAVIAGCAVIACAAWLLLRKNGKTQWMWAVLPVLFLAAAGAAVLLAGGSSMNSPVAASAVNLVQDATGKTTRFTGVIAAAPRPGLHSYSVEGEALNVLAYDGSYWVQDEDEEDTLKEPSVLRIVYRNGTQNEIAVNTETSWETVRMEAIRPEEQSGQVEAEIWMESDGLHGTVRNGLPYSLKEGAVICIYGFVKIPALAPGESADFALLSETAANPGDPVFENGKMYRNVTSSAYQVVYQMVFGKKDGPMDPYESTLISMMSSTMDYLADSDRRSSGQSRTVFAYCAEPEEDLCPPVIADGQEAEGKSGITILNAEITYLTVGKTGVVFHAPGMDKAVRSELNSDGTPGGDMPEDTSSPKYYNYYDLNELPTFRFCPDGISDVEVSKLIIGMDDWYTKEARCYVFNIRLKTWVEAELNTPLQHPEQYLDGNGNLWCQFRPAVADSYTSIPVPTITVEGTLKTK